MSNEKLLEISAKYNLHWSFGTHQEWVFDCRLWTYYYNKNKKKFIPTVIGQGLTLESAIADCLEKFQVIKETWQKKEYIK